MRDNTNLTLFGNHTIKQSPHLFSPDYVASICVNDSDCALDETPIFKTTTPEVDPPDSKPMPLEFDPLLLNKVYLHSASHSGCK